MKQFCMRSVQIGLIGLILVVQSNAEAATWYVDASSAAMPGVTGYGQSWMAALPFLQDALTAAQPGDTIRIAQGEYYPDDDDDFPIIPGSTHNDNDRTHAFIMTPNVVIEGGYRGIAGLPGNADIRDAETILSGDIVQDDDQPGGTPTNNSRTVVQAGTTAVPINNNAVLNGVTIEHAIQLIGDTPASAGLVVGVDSSPRFINCTIRNCVGVSKTHIGGGVDVFGDPNAETLFQFCTIESNRCGAGGGILITGGRVRMEDCTIRDNETFNDGGLDMVGNPIGTSAGAGFLLHNNAVAAFTRCDILDNLWDASAAGYVTLGAGAGGDASGGELFMRDCNVIGNALGVDANYSNGGAGGGIAMNSDDVVVTTLFDGNIIYGKFGCYGGGIHAAGGEIVNCVLRSNTASPSNHGGTSGGGAIATNGATQITNTLMHDNFTWEFGGAIRDRSGNATLVNCTIAYNTASVVYGGAYFETEGGTSSSMTNCIAWGNVDDSNDGVTWVNQIFMNDSNHLPTVSHTCIEDPDINNVFLTAGTNIIIDDPLFTTTMTGPYHLADGSPCLDSGTNVAVPDDDRDVNVDFDFDEPTPELDLMDRIVYGGRFDPLTFDCVVDMGVHELLVECDTDNAGDLNGDDAKDGLDIQPFVDCLLTTPAADQTCNCRRGDFRDADGVNLFDVPLFVTCILSAGTDCVIEFCPPGGGAIMSPPDCNENEIPDDVDIAYGCDPETAPELCDCNGNGIPDGCDIANETSDDIDEDGTPDECQPDCNSNSIPDSKDIADETSDDCDENGVPDECDPDCNENETVDACETLTTDCNSNDIPDECELGANDCNDNEVPDDCELEENDCNENGYLDACDLSLDPPFNAPDCNNNGIPDLCDIADCESDPDCDDCNENNIPDECDIANEISDDTNENGIPDECESEQMMMGGGESSSSSELTEDEKWAAYMDWCFETDFSSMSAGQKFTAALSKRLELGLPAGQLLP